MKQPSDVLMHNITQIYFKFSSHIKQYYWCVNYQTKGRRNKELSDSQVDFDGVDYLAIISH